MLLTNNMTERLCESCIYRGKVFDANKTAREVYTRAPEGTFPVELKCVCTRKAYQYPVSKDLDDHCGEGEWRHPNPLNPLAPFPIFFNSAETIHIPDPPQPQVVPTAAEPASSPESNPTDPYAGIDPIMAEMLASGISPIRRT